MKFDGTTPRQSGFSFPGEFMPQRALWLSWPHRQSSWLGMLHRIFQPYCEFILLVSRHQKVCINVGGRPMQQFALDQLQLYVANIPGARLHEISFYIHPTNDAWCRDHGPAFVVNRSTGEKAVVDWDYNAWGGKYPPYNLDNAVPSLIGTTLGMKIFHTGIVMEGGSVEFNGAGTVLTTTDCLLNKNRNPHLDQSRIEAYLSEYYDTENVLWLSGGIEGDDTDGHIDNLVRFVNKDTVITVVEENSNDSNYGPLQDNLKSLQGMRLENGSQLNIAELPMPGPVVYNGQRLPASYANFYIANRCVVVPTYRDSINDRRALEIIQSCFPDREVIGLDSTDLILGLGSFHCLSQQEPQ